MLRGKFRWRKHPESRIQELEVRSQKNTEFWILMSHLELVLRLKRIPMRETF